MIRKYQNLAVLFLYFLKHFFEDQEGKCYRFRIKDADYLVLRRKAGLNACPSNGSIFTSDVRSERSGLFPRLISNRIYTCELGDFSAPLWRQSPERFVAQDVPSAATLSKVPSFLLS
ncbi:hypothetical protein NPIL_4271 [Nephila pilipes]|uniref:Uncharacterized protein n=1 Tax=Nephila pilipes TaxID=299642 RepID=A0A8X6MH24_NEPPI|nr:hypothetical protein NPIL_4271 [Nephila pilipes]